MLLQGGPPPAPPAPPRGAGLSARRLCKIRTHRNVEVCGRSEDETPRKCILQAENIMPGSKKLWEEHLFPSEKIVFSPFGRKNNHFFLGKQKFASEFFCPWHNVSTQKEHIFSITRTIFSHSFGSKIQLFLSNKIVDLLWEKIVLVIEKDVWIFRPSASNLQTFWDQQLKVSTSFQKEHFF